MPQILSSQIETLKRARMLPEEVWQGGVFRMPVWMEGEDGLPTRAWAPFWASKITGKVFSGPPISPDQVEPARALDALAMNVIPGRAGYLPGRLEVRDPALAVYLREALVGLEIEIAETPELEAVDEFLEDTAHEFGGPGLANGTLLGEGVTVERVRSFAEAAKTYYNAGPWRHLTDEDLVRVESAVPARILSHFVVMGAAGVACGLGFFAGEDDFEELIWSERPEAWLHSRPHWHFDFEPAQHIPFADVDLWEDEKLPLAASNAYPHAYCLIPGKEKGNPSLRVPDAATLAYLEGLLRVLAVTTEDEMDSGQWTRRVSTFDGEVEMTLSLPGILEPDLSLPLPFDPETFDRRLMEKTARAMTQLLEDKEFRSEKELNDFINRQIKAGNPPKLQIRNDRDKAQDLFYQALEARGRPQRKLLREAIALDPDCADAYVLLAEVVFDRERALDLYQKGMAAGERSLGKKMFEENAGEFYMIHETRGYMRARAGVAYCLQGMGREEEAMDHFRELLRLNPNDNQGIRFNLLPLLLDRGLDDEVERLLETFSEDATGPLRYTRALLAFRKEGDTPESRKLRDAAVRANSHMVKYLTGKKESTGEHHPGSYALGSEEEALLYGPRLAPSWSETRGARAWLGRWRSDRKKAEKGKKKGASAKGRRRK